MPEEKMPKRRPLLLLIDGSHAMFRAFYAIRNLRGPDGSPTNAVFGFTSMLLKMLDDHKPDYVLACFDGSERGFRAEIDPNYKANRPPMPPELKQQWPIALRVTEELGVQMLEDDRLEADDIIATLAVEARAKGVDVLISSGDKDLMALVADSDPTGKYDGARIRQLEEKRGASVIYDEAGVIAKWGVRPEQIGDLLAIMGDSVDNVPGVKGIGKKGAMNLLTQYPDLESIYADIDAVKPPRAQKALREYEDACRMSRVLVELVTDAELAVSVEDLNVSEPDKNALTRSFRELGFKRLLREYFTADEAITIEVQTISDRAGLVGLVAKLRAEGRFGIDVITTERDEERQSPMRGGLVGVALAGDNCGAFYVPIDGTPAGTTGDLFGPPPSRGVSLATFVDVAGPLLTDPDVAVIGHDLKYAIVVLRRAGIELAGVRFDTLLAAYLVHVGRSRPALHHLALENLNCKMVGFEDTFGAGRNKVEPAAARVEAVARFVGERAALPLKLQAGLQKGLDDGGLAKLHDELEIPLTIILADLEHRGVYVDKAELDRQSIDLATRCADLQSAIHGHAGGPFNIGSPKQLGVVLFDKLELPAGRKTKTGWSTNQAVLEKLRGKHPIIDDIFSWRQLSKLKSTYTDALPALIHPDTGRVHTSLGQAIAATGRLSSAHPNLQNIPIRTPEGKRVRRAFVGRPGCVLLSADYSQIELRVMAHLADEPTMQAAFRDGVDIHRGTAARIFHVDLDAVTPEQRSAAKTINFGILYGMGATRLAASIGVKRKEAKEFIERYFDRFAKVKDWVDMTLERARAEHEVRTMFGRRRVVAEINSSDHMTRAAAERVAVNTPVQGSAADIIKRAMVIVDKELRDQGAGARMLLQVHDELLLEVPRDEADDVTKLVVEAMAGAAELSVPLKVDARYADNWADAH